MARWERLDARPGELFAGMAMQVLITREGVPADFNASLRKIVEKTGKRVPRADFFGTTAEP